MQTSIPLDDPLEIRRATLLPESACRTLIEPNEELPAGHHLPF